MKRRNIFIIIAGCINLFTTFLHLIGGQIGLVNPLMAGDLKIEEKSQWLGAWHIVTILLFFTSIILLKGGLSKSSKLDKSRVLYIAILYLLLTLPFFYSSIIMDVFTPQWILMLPIGILSLIGWQKKQNRSTIKI